MFCNRPINAPRDQKVIKHRYVVFTNEVCGDPKMGQNEQEMRARIAFDFHYQAELLSELNKKKGKRGFDPDLMRPS